MSVIFGPFVDCDILPAQPATVGTQVPAVFGSNGNDGSLFVYTYFPRSNISSGDYDRFLNENFLSAAPLVKTRYPLLDPSKTFQTMSDIIAGAGFRCPAARGARLASSKNIPVWTYSFNHTPSCGWYPDITNNPLELKILGPAHSAEIPFAFGITENLPPPDGDCDFNTREKQLSMQMSAAWTSMATNGTPGNGTDWPIFARNQSLGVNIQDEIVPGYVGYSICNFWDNVNDILTEEVLGSATAMCLGDSGSPDSPVMANGARITTVKSSWLLKTLIAGTFVVLLLFEQA